MIGLKIEIDDTPYEFLIHLKQNSDKIICMASDAMVNPQNVDRTQPFFNRWRWADEITDSVIYFNDPTLYLSDDLIAGWGIGFKDNHYLETVALIIQEILNNLNLENEDILFYGCSAGGFMSLMLATLVKDSYAVADVSQLNLKFYDKIHYDNLLTYCFPDMNENEVLEKYSHRLSVIDMIKKQKYTPKATLICDFSYLKDITRNYLPFFRELNEISFDESENKIQIIIHGRNIGHKPLEKPKTLKILNNFFKLTYDDWNSVLK